MSTRRKEPGVFTRTLSDGRVVHDVVISTRTATGTRRQVWSRGHATPTAARKVRRDLLHKAENGGLADAGRLTVASYLSDRWLPHSRTRTRGRTGERYAQLVRDHIVPQIGALPLGKVRLIHVQQTVDAMMSAGASPRSVVQMYRVLSCALRQAVRWELIPTNPAAAVRPPRPERPVLTVPTATDCAAILSAAEGTLFHTPLLLAVATGMRRGEVLGLTWGSVDLDAGLVRVTSTLQRVGGRLVTAEPKTDRSRRAIMLPAFAVAALRAHRAEQIQRLLRIGHRLGDTDHVVDRGDGSPIDPGHLSHAFDRFTTKAGVDGVRLHDLRHAYACRQLEAGTHPKVVSEALGHASVGFTLDVYSHLLPSMQQTAADAMDRTFAGLL